MKHRALALLTVLTVAACSGSTGPAGAPGENGAAGANGANGANGATGATGPTGPAGQDLTATAKPESCAVCHATAGTDHQALFNTYTDATKLAVTFPATPVTVTANANGTFKATVRFTLTMSGQPYTAGTTLGQKRVYFQSYDATPGGTAFTTARYLLPRDQDPVAEGVAGGGTDPSSPVSFAFGSLAPVAGVPGDYTMVYDGLSADPLADATIANAFVYALFADKVAVKNVPTTSGRYALYDNIVNAAVVVKGTIAYTSAANVEGCQKCHPTPYGQHGYRQAKVAGVNDFVACKACHTDQRRGSDGAWFLLADDPAARALVADWAEEPATVINKYAYTANVMNDTHNTHAMEFPYPQSMANCVTCHEGKLDRILTDANFNITTCKSCHPVTGPAEPDPKRAPPLKSIMLPASIHSTFELYNGIDGLPLYTGSCTVCHRTGGAKTFAEIHTGYDRAVYGSGTAKVADTVKASVVSASFDKATNKATVKFKVDGAAAQALVKPTVVVSLYGYDTKDFVVSGHSSQFADKTPNLEWTEGATIRNSNPPVPANTSRLTVAPATATAGNANWTAVADLTTWASKLADGSVKRIEIGFLPVVGLDQTKAVSATNPAIAAAGVTATVAVSATATDALLTGAAANARKDIVDSGKCNACHDALGTSFHSPSYGSAGVAGCRLCHFVGTGGSHLEMQSRSIDSYVHAIHSFQAFDIQNVNFADTLQAFEYEEHIGHTYPSFSILNCQSCHNAGKFDVPDQSKSLPSILSKSATIVGKDRNIGTVPSYVTGPASRACGSCHRAQMIKEDDAGKLAAFDQHTADNGFMLVDGTGVFDAAVLKIMSLFK